MIVLRNLDTSGAAKEGRYDSFFAGLMGGYAVFGRQRGSISQQVRTSALLAPSLCRNSYWDLHLLRKFLPFFSFFL
jgi:hypothetical protein